MVGLMVRCSEERMNVRVESEKRMKKWVLVKCGK